MAKIKESELPTIESVDDADYVRIVTADGESRNVTVEVLAEALEE